ncbi:putative fungal specific transcription factor [Diplodia seriata]|uniref:Putative fungal specific transcription factor n=1 Tax=Diplodia seriata TaxID=420778 RepID=A0A0G2GEL4_9PEZI|nr:putative fungal specific transcription factor [Diplodia seriata]
MDCSKIPWHLSDIIAINYRLSPRKPFEDRAFSPQLTHQLVTDKSWSALYHAVLAIGSQYHGRGSFEPGKGQAWKYFEVTLSLCPDLLIFKANLTTVQALTAMLESITVSQAARMAQSLGYNRATGSSATAIQRTFWLLNDHDIGFAPPSHPEPAFQNFDWLQAFSRYARLVSRIYANLFAINAIGKSASGYYATIDELRGELESWRASVPEPFRPGGAFRVRGFGGGSGPPATTVAVFAQYLYCSVLLALSRGTLHVARTTEEHAARHQEAKRELMGTARRVLELSKHVEVEAFSHVWVLVFMPLSALFILFDFVVHNPVHPETNNNLALLDIAGGHFSHLEYVSNGTLPASLVAEFAHIARQYVQDFRMQQYQKMKGVVPAQQQPMGASGCELPNPPGLEYTDPLVFSLGDDMVSEPTDSAGLGVDIMDLFDIDLSDIWSLAV